MMKATTSMQGRKKNHSEAGQKKKKRLTIITKTTEINRERGGERGLSRANGIDIYIGKGKRKPNKRNG